MTFNKRDQLKVDSLRKHIKQIFFEPNGLSSYNELILGKRIGDRRLVALASNTYRGFHKIKKSSPGASKVFTDYFIQHRQRILTALKAASNINMVDKLSDEITTELRTNLSSNIINHQLSSYNKVRKPVDIVIEMIVCLTLEITNVDRARLVPMLRLPLDSWMFKDEVVFAEEDLNELSIKRTYPFQSIKEKKHYLDLQDYIRARCKEMGNDVYPVCLDLFWNNRYKRSGRNIADLN